MEAKPVYRLDQLVRDVLSLVPRVPDLWEVWGCRSLDPALREEIMLAVAAANRCRWCSFMHDRWASWVGVTPVRRERIRARKAPREEPARRAAIAYAMSRVGTQRKVPTDIEKAFELAWPESERRWIDTVVRVMDLSNRSSNTFDALLARLDGRPQKGSDPVSEVAVGAAVASAIPAAAALIALRDRVSPLQVVRDFRAFSEAFEKARPAKPRAKTSTSTRSTSGNARSDGKRPRPARAAGQARA